MVGGDTTSAPQLVLSVTALGRSERVPGRAGAHPGDLLVVTGPLGAAGAAFRRPARAAAAASRRGPRPGRPSRTRCRLSDGLAVDAGHLARRSGCRLRLTRPRPARLGRGGGRLGFGEDYELLAATPDPLGSA